LNSGSPGSAWQRRHAAVTANAAAPSWQRAAAQLAASGAGRRLSSVSSTAWWQVAQRAPSPPRAAWRPCENAAATWMSARTIAAGIGLPVAGVWQEVHAVIAGPRPAPPSWHPAQRWWGAGLPPVWQVAHASARWRLWPTATAKSSSCAYGG
jgi:hypothetical protein